MSAMCTKESCTTRKGLCLHEKMMLAVMVSLGAGASGHFLFHWF